MSPSIAIVGLACRYADARSPAELWENALARRRAFRRIPPERLRLEDYLPRTSGDPDATYAVHAALLEGYEFDRVRFRVGASAFRSADLAHWLALDVASDALADAGFRDGDGLPREAAGVIVGNTLTGELSRADGLRLRFPYVRRVVEAELAEAGIEEGDRRALLERLEARYKAPFAPPNEDTLAGGLSNTIAGRVCNHFDLHGGGYTIDGACASSLLAVTTACSALAAGDLDVALAGGVDVSLDPFELVGFARVGALATESMRVYDARSAGFWPGEGAGFAVLMRLEDALASSRRIYAIIRGWGVSSDGAGSITRPEVEGQMLAIRRAYARAGFGCDTVGYFEGHGTGTAVGDAVELRALSRARREANPAAPPAAIGSIKANIGHTKAAAGIAGLIKATLAVHAQILPPATGCESPHAELSGPSPALRALAEGEPWPADRPLRAGVSAAGFGGINTHVAIEGCAAARRRGLAPRERELTATQDAELFLFGAETAAELGQRLSQVAAVAPRISFAELADLATSLAGSIGAAPRVRAAIVAATPDELAARLDMLSSWISGGRAEGIDVDAGVFLGSREGAPRIGFLFPGQGAPVRGRGGALERRFDEARRTYDRSPLPESLDPPSTAAAQPAIVLASLAAVSVLRALGISASTAVGHSLGELAALAWAGALDDEAAVAVACARGAIFAELGQEGGAMAAIAASPEDTSALVEGTRAVVAGLNGPKQTVVSGPEDAVLVAVERARARGVHAAKLRVSHAFHSPLMAPAAPALGARLLGVRFARLERAIISTVTGAPLDPESDLRELLVEQVTAPVRFAEALRVASRSTDLFLEVGPGRALEALARELVTSPAIALDAGGPSIGGLLAAVAAAFALGAGVDVRALFAGRFTRPFDLARPLRFIANPCESAPLSPLLLRPFLLPGEGGQGGEVAPARIEATGTSPLDVVFALVTERTELPRSALRPESRLLRDLHLSSIAVGQLVIEATRRLGLSPSRAPADYAAATIAEVAQALEDLSRDAGVDAIALPSGVDAWVRPFFIDWVPRPAPRVERERAPSFRVLAREQDALGAALRSQMAGTSEDGVIVVLPDELDPSAIAMLLEGARLCRGPGASRRFAVVHRGAGAAFAKTLHLEMPDVTAVAVEVPLDHPSAAGWVIAEATAASRFVEVRYDANGVRSAPVMRVLPDDGDAAEAPIGRDDVLLVTGGGKGIAFECALALARETGARVGLIGRSRRGEDEQLDENLDRLAASGVVFCYAAADVTEAASVRAACRELEGSLGAVSAVLHGAGTNTPALLGSLDEPSFSRTLAVKLQGLSNVLSAIDGDRLRALVAFSSIIGRAGMRGEADYAVANEALSRMVDRFAGEHPSCRCLSIEWSVWSGVGMGERLGSMEALVRQGITPIAPDRGVAMLSRLLRAPGVPSTVVVAGRLGDSPTLEMDRPELPLLRFLEEPKIHVRGVELVAESALSVDGDPYLADHVLSGEPLFPAVMGLEAMAQVAAALAESAAPARFEEVRFDRPIVVPRAGKLRIRVAALVRAPGRIDVVVRSESTGFQVDHFRATCLFGPLLADDEIVPAPEDRVALDPREELYGGLLFQQGRFQRLSGYRRLSSTGCVADVDGGADLAWFGRFLPSGILLGDPALRDVAMHAIQACVPHATLLPVAIERVTRARALDREPAVVHARERSHEGDTFVYDVTIADARGAVLERWTGLTLRVARGEPRGALWPEALLGPYVERRVRELVPGAQPSVAVHREPGAPRRAASDRAIQLAAGAPVTVRRRGDGKPEVVGLAVSASHAGDVTLAVSGSGRVGCDLEAVVARPASVWRELLGAERFGLADRIAREVGEDIDTAATRLWTARESLQKAGAPPGAPLVLAGLADDGWVTLASGSMRIASHVATLRRDRRRLAVAVLVEACRESV